MKGRGLQEGAGLKRGGGAEEELNMRGCGRRKAGRSLRDGEGMKEAGIGGGGA